MTCVQPRIALRASSRTRRSPRWTSQPSRIQSGASRWSDTRTSNSGSLRRRRTTAAPIVPAPPVTRTRLTAAPPLGCPKPYGRALAYRLPGSDSCRYHPGRTPAESRGQAPVRGEPGAGKDQEQPGDGARAGALAQDRDAEGDRDDRVDVRDDQRAARAG